VRSDRERLGRTDSEDNRGRYWFRLPRRRTGETETSAWRNLGGLLQHDPELESVRGGSAYQELSLPAWHVAFSARLAALQLRSAADPESFATERLLDLQGLPQGEAVSRLVIEENLPLFSYRALNQALHESAHLVLTFDLGAETSS